MNPSPELQKAIGMFDSGVGGLTVMREVIKALPTENVIYFADTARIPYGEKSRDTIIRYSRENSTFLINKSIKLLVVACNTASAYALDDLKTNFNVPIVGVIESGAEKAVEVTKNGRIAVLGTRGTINSGIYERELLKRIPNAYVHVTPCPLLVPMIEEKWIDHPVTRQVVKEYLDPIRKLDVDTLLLGCTHYPLLKNLFQSELGDDVTIVDSATTCSEKVKKTLENSGLKASSVANPYYHYYVTDDPHKFKNLSKDFLGMATDHVFEASTSH